MAKKQRKEALAALDRANKEYKNVCEALKDKYAELDSESDAAIELISDVEALVESVRRRPWSYKAMKMKIKRPAATNTMRAKQTINNTMFFLNSSL